MLDLLGFPPPLFRLTMDHLPTEDLIRFFKAGDDESKNAAFSILKARFEKERAALLENQFIDESKKEALRAIDPNDLKIMNSRLDALNGELVRVHGVGLCRYNFNLSKLGLTRLPIDIAEMLYDVKIQNLNLSHNQLSSLPTAFDDITTIEELDLSHNPLTVFPLCAERVNILKLSCDQYPLLPASLKETLSPEEHAAFHASNADQTMTLILKKELNVKTFDMHYREQIISSMYAQIECLDLPTAIRLKQALENFMFDAACDLDELTPEEREILQILSVSQEQYDDFMEKTRKYFGAARIDGPVTGRYNGRLFDSYANLAEHFKEQTLAMFCGYFNEKLTSVMAEQTQAENAAAAQDETQGRKRARLG